MKHKRKSSGVRFSVTPGAFMLCAAALAFGEPRQILGIFFALVLHEGGHLCAICGAGSGVGHIRIRAGGAEIVRRGGLLSYGAEALIALAGVFANLCAFGALALAGESVCYFALCNFAFAVLNLLPVRGLDGGEALCCLLSMRCTPDTAARVLGVSSGLCLFALWLASVYILLLTYSNISLFVLCLCLFAPLAFRRHR